MEKGVEGGNGRVGVEKSRECMEQRSTCVRATSVLQFCKLLGGAEEDLEAEGNE